MILEGFEIENWSCIQRLAISGLPRSGVIVLHGPNRTGKSSLVQALRACLMDYKSDTKALTSSYPRGRGERPMVSVTFAVGGTSYRVTKNFGSSKSELASRTSTGAWKVETTTAAEVHSRVCELAGGNDSTKGLHQLLWLTQAEFRLPEAKKFDPGVQAQLRGILGVLQTALDDRFLARVKDRWNVWYAGQRNSGTQRKIKAGCTLAQNLTKLSEQQQELNESERKFVEVEGLVRRTNDLESQKHDLNRQREQRLCQWHKCQQQRERSQARIAARALAEVQHTGAVAEQQSALEEEKGRADAAKRLKEAEDAVGPEEQKVESLAHSIQLLEAEQSRRRSELGGCRGTQRALKQRSMQITAQLTALDNADKLCTAQDDLRRAQDVVQRAAEITAWLSDHPVPDAPQLAALKENRQKVSQLQADRDAASMTLRIVPAEGAEPAELAIDGAPTCMLPTASSSPTYSVRRKAELQIPAWGRVELTRGAGASDLDQIEADLRQCNEEFADAMASLGIAANDPDAMDQLLRRNAEHGLKNVELHKEEKELKRLAPKGLDPLQRKVLELETKLKDAASREPEGTDALPVDRRDLDELKSQVDDQIKRLDDELATIDSDLETRQTKLVQSQADATGAKEELARRQATAKGCREEVQRLRTEELIAQRIAKAKSDLEAAKTRMQESELTAEERTIEGRLAEAKEAVDALDRQLREVEEKYNTIKGRLEASEGLHARRAALSARVDELTRLTQAESLERDAVDRLYELFEECREKQLGTLMEPIHDRVLNWMRVLDIGDYKEVRFTDAFLPERLVRRDGTGEFEIAEESTGAQEQIGMLVRLALGSLLTSTDEPAVAILDDPLTHCDVGRLNTMRAILRRAAEGDPTLCPPVGPLQIIILTCHPEWFRDERATVIDLEDAKVMQRIGV